MATLRLHPYRAYTIDPVSRPGDRQGFHTRRLRLWDWSGDDWAVVLDHTTTTDAAMKARNSWLYCDATLAYCKRVSGEGTLAVVESTLYWAS